MNTKHKFAFLGLILAVLILAIIGTTSDILLQKEIIKPPPAILKLDGKEQISSAHIAGMMHLVSFAPIM